MGSGHPDSGFMLLTVTSTGPCAGSGSLFIRRPFAEQGRLRWRLASVHHLASRSGSSHTECTARPCRSRACVGTRSTGNKARCRLRVQSDRASRCSIQVPSSSPGCNSVPNLVERFCLLGAQRLLFLKPVPDRIHKSNFPFGQSAFALLAVLNQRQVFINPCCHRSLRSSAA